MKIIFKSVIAACFIFFGYLVYNNYNTSVVSIQRPINNLVEPISLNKKVYKISSDKNFAAQLQETLITAKPGSVIELPEGVFKLQNEISISKPFITLKGKGKGKTILDFSAQTAGKQGIFATNDGVTLEDFTVLNTDGNGIKVTGSNGVIIRRIEMKWTRGPNTENGGYAIYPVNTQNLLIEHCEVSGASDSGIYVGQSKNVIVRNNLATENVAGIEIENTQNADVYDNEATGNTAGILIFDLPNLNLRQGNHIRVYNNLVHDNNQPNFAPKGNIVGSVAKGIGILILATKNIEIFNNTLSQNNFSDIVIANYLITGLNVPDEKVYDPTPNTLFIHDNTTSENKKLQIDFSNEINIIANYLFSFSVPDIIYDGIRDGNYNKKKFETNSRICLSKNKSNSGKKPSFGNMHLDSGKKFLIFPGGPVTRDTVEHECELPKLSETILSPPVYNPILHTNTILEENNYCDDVKKNKVNFNAALSADCIKLSSYNLFVDSKNPLSDPVLSDQSQAMPYDLTSPLFTDYALKSRFIFTPPNSKILYRNEGVFDFPIGTIIAKTFWYKKNETQKIIETRLLIHRKTGWIALPYVWNTDQSEAVLNRGGSSLEISLDFIDSKKSNTEKFTYHIPNSNQCIGCHSLNGVITPIGPKAKLLNREGIQDWVGKNQITEMIKKNILKVETNSTDLNAPNEYPRMTDYRDATASIESRARAYLDINCAHCHNPIGNAGMSGLWLENDRETTSQHSGICKHPIAAGTAAADLKHDIKPGFPDKSILVRRMQSNRPANKMPELGRSLAHEEGVQLIESWIKQLKGNCDLITK